MVTITRLRSQPSHLAYLLGAASALRRACVQPIRKADLPEHEALVQEIRSVLGTLAFNKALENGESVVMRDAIGCVSKMFSASVANVG